MAQANPWAPPVLALSAGIVSCGILRGRSSQGRAVLDSFRKTFHLLGRDNRCRWVVLIFGAIVTSAVEMLGAAMVFVLLALVVDPGGELQVPVVGDLRTYVGGVDEQTFLLTVAVAMGVFFLLRFAVQVGYAYVKQRLAHNAGARLASTLVGGYLRMPYALHLRRSSAELVRNAQQTVDSLVTNAFIGVIQVLSEAVLVVGLVVVMVVIAPAATLLAVVVLGPVVLLVLKVVQPRLKRLGAVAQDARRDAQASVQQSLYGIRDIRILGRAPYFTNQYRQTRDSLARALYIRGTVIELPRLIIETSLVGFILVLFGYSIATGVASERLLSTLGLFAYAGLRIQPSLQKLVSGLNNVRFEGPAIDQVHADLVMVEALQPGSGEPIPFESELRCEGVSFTYEEAERPAVRDVDLVIRRGELIGVCGPTGGGKTTLTDLLTGLLPPTAGRVVVDGADVQVSPEGWYRNLGIVPQMVFLVDDTLRRNIALGLPDDEVDEGSVWQAVRNAQLADFVDELPRGLDTMVGERGVRMSGGQRQRVAIARALYHRPRVLVFDEGTSALDTSTESVLMESLERLRGSHTIILVAHRLSTVRNCDRILYIERGRVEAQGTFQQLESSSPGFRALAQRP